MSSSSDGKTFDTQITADASKFEQGMRQAVQAAVTSSDQINAQFKKVADAVSKVNAMIMGLTAVLAGGGALKKFISDATEWNITVGKMASQLGITTEQASVLKVALHGLGIDGDVYVGASQKLSKQIQSNGQAFDVLGVKVRDVTTGAYRPVTEVMEEVNQKLREIKNPIEQNIAGQQVYGKGWAEIRTILRLTSEQLQDAAEHTRKLNLLVGDEGVAMSRKYTAQMRDLELVGEAMTIQFGNGLLPVFTKIGAAMSTELPKSAMTFGKVLGAVMETVTVIGANLQFVFEGIGRDIGAVAAGMVALLSGDLEGAARIHEMAIEDAKRSRKELDELEQKVLAVNGELQGIGQRNAGGGRGFVNPPVAQAKDPQYHFKDKSLQVAPDPSRMAAWEAELAAKKATLEREGMLDGQYREMSKTDELAYWKDLSAQRGLNDTEKIALARKTAEAEMALIKDKFDMQVATLQTELEQYKNNMNERLRIEREIQAKYQQGTKEYEAAAKAIVAIQRQAADQIKAVAQSRAEAERDALLQTIALEEQTSRQAEQLGVITHGQLLRDQQGFEDRRFAIAASALQERLQMAEEDPDRNPVEVERIHREIEKLESDHQLRMAQIKSQLATDSNKYLLGAVDGIANGFEGIVQRIGTQIKSLNDLFRASLDALIQVGMQAMAKIAGDWLRQELMLRLFGKASAMGKIAEQSAAAGAGGVASMAAAPFPLNLSAPAFGAAMSAAAMAFAPLASAAGGYDIPGTNNPLIQAHANEMVLPAKHADVIRNLADGGSGGGGNVNVSIEAHPMPGNYFMVHRDQLVKAIKSAVKDNAWSPTRP